jgi:hypothetical protein
LTEAEEDEEMGVLELARKLWWRKQKVTWTMRLARFFSRSRSVALFAGLVALIGGAREMRRRASHA